MARIFKAEEAKREAVPLLVSLTGPSGSGKTMSALRLATGMQKVSGGDIVFIDTENRRGLHYAEKFKFKHMQFDPPFASLDYLSAMQQAVNDGAKVIVVDSMSHEHSAEGGMIDAHEAELTRLAGQDYGKRERMTMLAWQKPKAARRKLLQGITRLNAHVILCFRAKETSKPVKDNGKIKIEQMGFMPEAGPEFVFECALGALFLPTSDGVPVWRPENMGEKMAVKLPDQFRWLQEYRGAMDESIGEKLAKWAAGGVAAPAPTKALEHFPKETTPFDDAPQDSETTEAEAAHLETIKTMLIDAAEKRGTEGLKECWTNLSLLNKRLFPGGCPQEYKDIAAKRDEAL